MRVLRDYERLLYREHEDSDTLPEIKGTNFSSKIMEYAPIENVNSEEDDDDEFRLSLSQRFLRMFISPNTPYRSLFVFHQLGTGKTCTAIQIAEGFRSMGKRVIIISSVSLHENFKKELFEFSKYDRLRDVSFQCTGMTLLDMVPNRHKLGDNELKKEINSIIQSLYMFTTYEKLANDEVFKRLFESEDEKPEPTLVDKKKIEKEFSDCVIIVDEAHRLRNTNKDKNSARAIELIAKYANDTRMIMMSATPMFHIYKEMNWFVDVLVENDGKKIPDNVKTDEDKIRWFSGRYVSYLRGQNPDTFPRRLYPEGTIPFELMPKVDKNGKEIEKRVSFIRIFPSVMSELQKTVYRNENKKRKIDLDQLVNVVYPGSDVGQRGFEGSYEIKDRNIVLTKNSKDPLSWENLGEYSPKIKNIIEIAKRSRGPVFVYSFYLWSGVIPMIVSLSKSGWSQYGKKGVKGNNGIFAAISGNSEHRIYNDLSEVIRVFTHESNKNGEKIKLLIGNDVISEGFDFKNVRQVHILEPWHNMSRMEQIIGRAIRTNSHKDLREEERNVTVFYHGCVFDNVGKDVLEETIDLEKYRKSENNQREISKFERIMKEESIDCKINLKVYKNIPEEEVVNSFGEKVRINVSDMDYSKECDFDVCDISCANRDAKIEKKSITLPYYEKRLIEEVVIKIKSIFFRYDEVVKTKIELYTKLGNHVPNDIIRKALKHMVKERVVFTNSAGVKGYIIVLGEKYYFQPEHIDDELLTLQERIEIASGKSKFRTMRIIIEKEKEEEEDSDSDEIESKGEDYYLRIVFDKVEEYRSLLKNIEDKINDKLLVEMVIDTLKEDEYFSIARSVVFGKKSDKRSMIISGYGGLIYNDLSSYRILSGDDDVMSGKVYMVSPFTGEYYEIKKMKKSKVDKIEDINRILKEGVISGDKKSKEYPIGFREINKKTKESNYKLMFDEKKSGTVCKAAGVKVDQLIEHIKRIYSDVDLEIKKKKMYILKNSMSKEINKEKLCILSEYGSRKELGRNFRRIV
jgi:superfamily II DNA or RNA helicase